MKIHADIMERAAKTGFMNATDAADYLVSKGIPFRECHSIIGQIVLYCSSHGKAIEDLSLDHLQDFSPSFEKDIFDKINIRSCIEAKVSEGSTSFKSVAKMIAEAKIILDEE